MLSNLKTRLKNLVADLSTPNDAALTVPLPQGEFVKGINFGGDAVTIEGYAWESYSSALALGLSTPGVNLLTTSIQPQPLVSRNIRRMLNTVVYRSQTLEIIQTLPNGLYEVYLWIMENYQSDWHALELSLADQTIATEIGKLGYSNWARYGPYSTTITDEVLRLTLSTNTSKIDAHIMGMSIFR